MIHFKNNHYELVLSDRGNRVEKEKFEKEKKSLRAPICRFSQQLLHLRTTTGRTVFVDSPIWAAAPCNTSPLRQIGALKLFFFFSNFSFSTRLPRSDNTVLYPRDPPFGKSTDKGVPFS